MIKRVTFFSGVRTLKDKILPVFATRISQMLELQNDPKIVLLKQVYKSQQIVSLWC